jgi:hypothetical protein
MISHVVHKIINIKGRTHGEYSAAQKIERDEKRNAGSFQILVALVKTLVGLCGPESHRGG